MRVDAAAEAGVYELTTAGWRTRALRCSRLAVEAGLSSSTSPLFVRNLKRSRVVKWVIALVR